MTTTTILLAALGGEGGGVPISSSCFAAKGFSCSRYRASALSARWLSAHRSAASINETTIEIFQAVVTKGEPATIPGARGRS